MTIESPRLQGVYSRSGFLPHIEGLRGVAVLLVVLYHAGIALIPGGYVGVDVFFVLSGFLITNHLLRELSTTGTVDFPTFYARRARRLLPAALTVIVATVIVVAVAAPPRLAETIFTEARAAILFVPNLLFAFRETDYLAEDSTSPLLHYWSLGVEEQFYIVWPLLLLILWRVVRGRAANLLVGLGGLVLLSLIASVVISTTSEPWGYFSPWTRAWELGIGALIAAGRLHQLSWRPGSAAATTWIGLAAIIAAALLLDESTVFPGYAALLPTVGTALVVIAAGHSSSRAAGGMLRNGGLRFFGRISYSLYLVHWPMLVLPATLSATGATPSAGALLALAGASVVLAWLLNIAVERPALRSPRLGALGSRRILVAAGGFLLASLLIVQIGSVTVAAKPLATSAVVAAPEVLDGRGEVAPPEFSDLVPANLTPPLAEASQDLPRIYADGCQLPLDQTVPLECVYGDPESERTIVLFGDSHAAQWFPALEIIAQREGLRLVSHTKSSCPPFDVDIINEGVVDEGCAAWRESVVAELEASPPEVVVMAGFAHYDEYGTPQMTGTAWAEGVTAVVSRLAASTDVLVIDDTPRFPRTPALCLSANLVDADVCSISRSEGIDTAWVEQQQEAATSAGARTLSLADRLCTAEVCGTILGNLLMYRDQHHLSTSIVRWLEPVIARAVLPGSQP